MIEKLKERIEQKKNECLDRIHQSKRKGMQRNFLKVTAYNETLEMISELENNDEYKAFLEWKKDQTHEDYLRFKETYINDSVVFNTKVYAPYSDFGHEDILEICPDGIVLNDKFKEGDNVRVIIVKDNKEE